MHKPNKDYAEYKPTIDIVDPYTKRDVNVMKKVMASHSRVHADLNESTVTRVNYGCVLDRTYLATLATTSPTTLFSASMYRAGVFNLCDVGSAR